jgi:hypothetical protein
MKQKLQKIEKALYRYRDAKQLLWNNYFYSDSLDLVKTEPIETFTQIDRLLFSGIVLVPCGISLPEPYFPGMTAIPGIRFSQSTDMRQLNVHLRPYRETGKGDWELKTFDWIKGLKMEFIDFFQWDSYSYLCMNQMLGRVVACSTHHELVGMEVILDAQDFCVKE